MTKEERYLQLINKYQQFTRWVLRYDKDIQESIRGKNLLAEIDAIELSIRDEENISANKESVLNSSKMPFKAEVFIELAPDGKQKVCGNCINFMLAGVSLGYCLKRDKEKMDYESCNKFEVDPKLF